VKKLAQRSHSQTRQEGGKTAIIGKNSMRAAEKVTVDQKQNRPPFQENSHRMQKRGGEGMRACIRPPFKIRKKQQTEEGDNKP